MKIDVNGILAQEIGTTETHSLESETIAVDEDTTAHVSGEVVLTKLEDFLLAIMTAQADVTTTCHRCLVPAQRQLDLHLHEEYYYTPQPDPDKLQIADGQIDLAPSLAGEIAVHLPISVLCSAKCQGLCPTCGTNLNTDSCSCPAPNTPTNKIDIPWQPSPKKR